MAYTSSDGTAADELLLAFLISNQLRFGSNSVVTFVPSLGAVDPFT